MHNSDYKLALTSSKIREMLITKILLKNNWQQNKTPMKIVDKMISKTDLTNKTILVLFNIEFVERLIHKYKISPEKIFFFSDNKNKRPFIEMLYGVKFISGNTELIDSKNKDDINPLTRRITEMGQKKFDLCFGNPPYNKGVDLKIIKAVEPLCEEIIVVHPSTWLLDLKRIHKPYQKFREIIKDKLKSIEFFNGNPIFNIGLSVPCVITHLDKHHKGNIKVVDKCNDHEYEVKNINNITKFGTDWEPIVEPFKNKMREYTLEKNDNVWKHNVKEINKNKFHCQLAAIRGTPYRGTDINAKHLLNDFYTLVMKDSDKNKGIRQPNLKKPGNPTPTFKFETENERDNFISYLKTDIVRFCLALYKNSISCSCDEMVLIPQIDFTQKWSNEELYKFFDIDKKTQKYIENFLPDFYNIRGKK